MNQYSLLIQWSEEDQLFLVTIPEFSEQVIMPCTHGKTREEAMRNGSLQDGEIYANKIRTAIRLIEIVKEEKYLDDVLMNDDWEDLKKAIAKQDKAKKVLFNYLHHNIEKWWN
jgi:hypothetical protein